MTPEKCPGCGAKLRPDMLACPNCPMSFPEDAGPRGSVNPLKQSRYYQFLFPALFFGAIGAAIWYLGMGLMHLGLANNQVESGNIFGEKTKAPAPATVGETVSGGASGPEIRPSEARPSDDDGVVMISHVGVQAAAATSKAPREWRLRGSVYDLVTLKPLAGCAIQFTNEATNRSIMTRSDSAGRYRTIVPSLSGGSGYSVSIEKSGYAPNYLNPGTEGVREMAAGERKGMARDLATTTAVEPATVQSVSEKPFITDFYLAPRL